MIHQSRRFAQRQKPLIRMLSESRNRRAVYSLISRLVIIGRTVDNSHVMHVFIMSDERRWRMESIVMRRDFGSLPGRRERQGHMVDWNMYILGMEFSHEVIDNTQHILLSSISMWPVQLFLIVNQLLLYSSIKAICRNHTSLSKQQRQKSCCVINQTLKKDTH
jgi:hypothetical protein